jgi:hypothetical protein
MMGGKSPAFLFYSSDFLTGTFFFTDEQVGRYIRALCFQHQNESLTEVQLEAICGGRDAAVFGKFEQCEDGLYRNTRLMDEMLKRGEHSKKQSDNAKKRWKRCESDAVLMPSHSDSIKMAPHLAMPLEDDNGIVFPSCISLSEGMQGETAPEPENIPAPEKISDRKKMLFGQFLAAGVPRWMNEEYPAWIAWKNAFDDPMFKAEVAIEAAGAYRRYCDAKGGDSTYFYAAGNFISRGHWAVDWKERAGELPAAKKTSAKIDADGNALISAPKGETGQTIALPIFRP